MRFIQHLDFLQLERHREPDKTTKQQQSFIRQVSHCVRFIRWQNCEFFCQNWLVFVRALAHSRSVCDRILNTPGSFSSWTPSISPTGGSLPLLCDRSSWGACNSGLPAAGSVNAPQALPTQSALAWWLEAGRNMLVAASP